jgi:hypothetical protein
MTPLRVLLAGSEGPGLRTLRDLLAREGLQVSLAAGGLQCLEALREAPPDVLVPELDTPWGVIWRGCPAPEDRAAARQPPLTFLCTWLPGRGRPRRSRSARSGTGRSRGACSRRRSAPSRAGSGCRGLQGRPQNNRLMTRNLEVPSSMVDTSLRKDPRVTDRREISQLETHVQSRLSGRLRDFRLEITDAGLVLRGHTRTYYAKQLAQHEVMGASTLPILANELEVA